MRKLRLSRLAENDLTEIYVYTFGRFGEHQADAYIASIEAAADRIRRFPSIGRPYIARAGLRFLQFRAARHHLFYQDFPEQNLILLQRVLHLAMDARRHLDREDEPQ